MKAWRNDIPAQHAFRKELLKSNPKLPSTIRVGRLMRDNFVKVLPVPSFLMQGLLIRAGVYRSQAEA